MCVLPPPRSGSTRMTSLPRAEERVDSDRTMQRLFSTESWDELQNLLREDPLQSRKIVTIQCQGERTPCLPLHAAVARRNPCLETVKMLATAYPQAVSTQENRGGRLPLHMALLKGGSNNTETVRHLCNLHPEALLHCDKEGNTPFHYACMYSSEETCRLLLEECPKASHIANSKERLPLHLLSAREDYSLDLFNHMIELLPTAVTKVDRNGRLPLHWACDTHKTRADILSVLVERHSAALLVRDVTGKTPQATKRLHGPKTSRDATSQFLRQQTARERRKSWSRIFFKDEQRDELSSYNEQLREKSSGARVLQQRYG